MITLLGTLFGVWYRFILICIYGCNHTHLKIQPHIKYKALLSKEQIIHKETFNKHAQSLKRPKIEPLTAVSDWGESSQDKRCKVSSSPCLPGAAPNKEQQNEQQSSDVLSKQKKMGNQLQKRLHFPNNSSGSTQNSKIKKQQEGEVNNDIRLYNPQSSLDVLERLPNTIYFKSLKLKINHDPNSPLAESVIEKLDAFHKLKLPYTFLSSVLQQCTDLYALDALLNKTLIKCASGGYAIESKLQHILNNNIKLSNLSSMVNGAGRAAPQTLEIVINKLMEERTLQKLQILKNLGITISNLSSMVNGSANAAPQTLARVINKLMEEQTLQKLQILKNLGITISNLSSMVNGSGNAAPQTLARVINKLMEEKTLEKLQILKNLGITISNLSSMVSGSGNAAPQTLARVINKLMEEKTLEKLQILKNLGITISNLSSMVSGTGKKAPQALETVINNLTEEGKLKKLQILKK
ncbi:Helix-turn-helix domain protein [Cardinium endosymbiont of Sogatella furcifera]|uniref:hypothetical protein n=1 Tax=Cardinium endosymbiont of Sogatella furcifera TaxID=650378 RepID=UPI000E0DAB35|nr:hypothetical protein [Cardinium endosymbiont of Sogatella furcifera]AXI24385.1 Helix-turn-helix domain protein [Cardinium endosymbiont of Sogatella furcifera]